jgi:hypothetical protein
MSRLRHAAQRVAGRDLRPRLGRITAHERRLQHPPHAALPAAPRAHKAVAVASLCGRNSTPAHEAHGHQVRVARTRGASGAWPAALDIKGMRSGDWGVLGLIMSFSPV